MTVTSIRARMQGGLVAVLIAAAWPAAAQTGGPPQGAAPPLLTPDDPLLTPEDRIAPEPAPAPRAPSPEAKKPPADKDAAPEQTTPEQQTKLLDELYARLATAPDEETAGEIAGAIEQLWQHSGSATADLLMARAAAAIESNRRDLAMKLLNAAVELQPDYAEAWNRRAYLHYLEDDLKRALGDIRRVLALEPQHFKAIEGLANILQQLGEKKAALEAYESLLKIYPKAPGVKKARDDLKTEVEGQGI